MFQTSFSILEKKFHLITQSNVNIEPVVCNSHLRYPWRWCRRVGRVGRVEVLDAGGVGVSGAKHQVEESAQRCAESVI